MRCIRQQARGHPHAHRLPLATHPDLQLVVARSLFSFSEVSWRKYNIASLTNPLILFTNLSNVLSRSTTCVRHQLWVHGVSVMTSSILCICSEFDPSRRLLTQLVGVLVADVWTS